MMDGKIIISVIVVMMILDTAWISANKVAYTAATEAIQKTPMIVHMPSAALAYATMAVAMLVFVVPRVMDDVKTQKRSVWASSLFHGGLLGFIVYGIYNFTSKALLTEYPWHIVIRDTLWGTALFTLVPLLCVYFLGIS